MRAWSAGIVAAVLLATACADQGAAAQASSGASTAASSSTRPVVTATAEAPATSATSTTSTSPATRTAPATSTSAAVATASTCADQALAELSPTARAGQVLLVGVPATSPLATGRTLAALHVGGIFLHGRVAGSSTLRTALASVKKAARADGTFPLFVSADEEGGLVQTVTGGTVPAFPTALVQGSWSTTTLRSRTSTWAKQIAALGLNLDLAPVADTVPASLGTANPPIGKYRREYGMTPSSVGRAIGVVVPALTAAHVGATVKHFPGLGRVHYNTDTSSRAVDSTTTATDPYLQPFVTGMKAGALAVMVSSARYPKLDSANPAMWSQKIVTGLLRQRLKWSGLVVSDDLGQAVAASSLSVAARATTFLRAGGDLVLTVQPSQAATMRTAIARAAAAHTSWRRIVDTAARRVLAAKISLGLIHC
jgi:beta-N-acetylhexosaminidase